MNALLAHCQGPARHRRRAAPGDRPPDRQGHLGPAGGRQGRRDDERARRRRSRRTRSSGSTRRWWRASRRGRAGGSTRSTGAIRATARSSPAACAPGKRAVTNWRVVERFPGAARMEARLETGRTHQVRVHLAALGCPLLGDKTYGRAAARSEAARHRRGAGAAGAARARARVRPPGDGEEAVLRLGAAGRHAGGAGGARETLEAADQRHAGRARPTRWRHGDHHHAADQQRPADGGHDSRRLRVAHGRPATRHARCRGS